MQNRSTLELIYQLPSTSKISKTAKEWKSHWKALGQEWRTEPEISKQRQTELEKHRALKPDEEKAHELRNEVGENPMKQPGEPGQEVKLPWVSQDDLIHEGGELGQDAFIE